MFPCFVIISSHNKTSIGFLFSFSDVFSLTRRKRLERKAKGGREKKKRDRFVDKQHFACGVFYYNFFKPCVADISRYGSMASGHVSLYICVTRVIVISQSTSLLDRNEYSAK